MPALRQDELAFISEAVDFLENPAAFMRFAQKFSLPIEKLQNRLPPKAQEILHLAVDRSMHTALKIAIESLGENTEETTSWRLALEGGQKSHWLHTLAVTTTGAVGGAFGFSSILVELPISTTIMLRSITDVARQWGENIHAPETQLQCLYVFSLGTGSSRASEHKDSHYLGSRLAFHKALNDAIRLLAQGASREILLGLEKNAWPQLVKLLAFIAPAFEKSMVRKLALEAVPFVGAIGGASINAAFCHYFTQAARYHFGLLHLERSQGQSAIASLYQEALADLQLPKSS